ncbi:MAG: TldD/PmbA family protein [Leptolyngbyaceae bacterium]|nr:TldD/PmbA family protein [Leptolyngbyaceae bacterium]
MFSELTHALSQTTLSADWIGLRSVKEIARVRGVRDGHPESNGETLSQGVMAEVLVNGQIGYGATNKLTPDGIQAAIRQAYHQAIAAHPWAIHPIPLAARPKVTGQYVSPFQKPLNGLTAKEINDLLVQLCQTMKVSDQVVKTSASATATDLETWFISSNDSEVYQHVLSIQTHFGATAQDGAIVQQRTNNGFRAHCYQGGWELFPSPAIWEQAAQVGEQAVELLSAEECPTGPTTLVLAPDQMMLQIHESVGHPLELDRILGDERNYAGGSFVQPKDFGHLSYGSPLMNITFDPSVPGEFASYSFDDTGTPATKEFVIKDGILLRGLGGLESQARSQIAGVACARASSWNRPPIDRMANLNLEPGSDSFADLISRVENGVYMEANRSWSIDDQRHKFQFGCEYAKRIENGRLTTTLRNPNYRATTPQFWHSLVGVGNAATWQMYGTPYCGKGEPNQVIRVGHGSPVCVFEQIDVFGGGA